MSLDTPLSRVRGLGSAKDGTRHWWAQRMTAIAMVPLVTIAVIAVISTTLSDYETARATLSHPFAAVLAVAMAGVIFYHGQLGLQVVIEDYLHVEWQKLVALIVVKFAAVVLALTAIVSVLRIAIGS